MLPLYLLYELHPVVVGTRHRVNARHSLDATGETMRDQTVDVLAPSTSISTYQWASGITLAGILIVSQRAYGIRPILWCPDVADNIPTLLVTYNTHLCLKELLLGWSSVTCGSIANDTTGF